MTPSAVSRGLLVVVVTVTTVLVVTGGRTAAQPPAPGVGITNGGFETGTFAGWEVFRAASITTTR